MIAPHGGRLVNRMVEGGERDRLLASAPKLPKVVLNAREMADVDMIAVGAMSPLQGFMSKADYDAVLATRRLNNGLPWTIPIVLAVKPGSSAESYKEGGDVALETQDGQLLAILHVDSKWKMDKGDEARKVLRTDDKAHPGVGYLDSIGDTYLGGTLSVVNRLKYDKYNNRRLDPVETRTLFKAKGWNTIAAFQTRNPIHRAHEYLTKVALEMVDGLMLHPLMGETKSDDVPADVRMQCYEALLAGYYPKERTALVVYPQAMRYGGPSEAVLHAICRKNYGVTHFLVGRDHAGVGNYYGSYDAQKIFDEYTPAELGINLMKFENSFWCKRTNGMASTKSSPATPEERVNLSGTQVREMLRAGQMPPVEFTRPEIAQILINAMKAK
ncbi:MAG: sulfate adenylyltransferase [Planctomycetes bacterium]|nr:sulfate adenylyltransferase [Planctomycetota bacterium]